MNSSKEPFIYVWEFLVRPGCEAEFERLYGPEGDWVQLFSKGGGYLGTALIRDSHDKERYLTIDSWRKESDHLAFKQQFEEEFKRLDLLGEKLTKSESLIGKFGEVTA
jgi:heme-degrading monooxygenase HmoA